MQKKIKNQNLIPKILSLFIAVMLWSYVMAVENPSETKTFRNIKVNFLNLENLEKRGLELMSSKTEYVNVRLNGKKKDLDKINQTQISAVIDLNGFNSGEVRANVDVKLEGSVGNVAIDLVSPSDIVLELDRIVTRSYDVKVVTDGILQDNYVIGEINNLTPKVSIKGPSAALDKVSYVETVVDVAGKTKPFTASYPVYAYDEEGEVLSNITVTPNIVNISVPIFQTVVLPIELVTEGSLPPQYEMTGVQINNPTVIVKKVADVTVPKTIKTEPVKLADVLNNTSQKLKLVFPEGIVPVESNIEYVLKYSINKYTTKEFVVGIEQTEFINFPDRFVINTDESDKNFRIELKAYESVMNNLQAGNLKFEADLSGAVEGKNKIKVMIKDSPDSSISFVNEAFVNITLVRTADDNSTDEEQ